MDNKTPYFVSHSYSAYRWSVDGNALISIFNCEFGHCGGWFAAVTTAQPFSWLHFCIWVARNSIHMTCISQKTVFSMPLKTDCFVRNSLRYYPWKTQRTNKKETLSPLGCWLKRSGDSLCNSSLIVFSTCRRRVACAMNFGKSRCKICSVFFSFWICMQQSSEIA